MERKATRKLQTTTLDTPQRTTQDPYLQTGIRVAGKLTIRAPTSDILTKERHRYSRMKLHSGLVHEERIVFCSFS